MAITVVYGLLLIPNSDESMPAPTSSEPEKKDHVPTGAAGLMLLAGTAASAFSGLAPSRGLATPRWVVLPRALVLAEASEDSPDDAAIESLLQTFFDTGGDIEDASDRLDDGDWSEDDEADDDWVDEAEEDGVDEWESPASEVAAQALLDCSFEEEELDEDEDENENEDEEVVVEEEWDDSPAAEFTAQALLDSFLAEGGSVDELVEGGEDDEDDEDEDGAELRAELEEALLCDAPPLPLTPPAAAAAVLAEEGVVRLGGVLGEASAAALRREVLAQLAQARIAGSASLGAFGLGGDGPRLRWVTRPWSLGVGMAGHLHGSARTRGAGARGRRRRPRRGDGALLVGALAEPKGRGGGGGGGGGGAAVGSKAAADTACARRGARADAQQRRPRLRSQRGRPAPPPPLPSLLPARACWPPAAARRDCSRVPLPRLHLPMLGRVRGGAA